MSTDARARIIIEAVTQEAGRDLQKVAQDLQKVGGAGENAGRVAKELADQYRAMGRAATAAAIDAAAVGDKKHAADLAKQATEANKLAAQYDKLAQSGQGAGRTIGQSLGDIRTATVIAMAAVTAAIATAKKAYAATVGEAMNYAGEVRQLSTITGQSAEATSRLVQVFGDFQIGTGEVTAAMRIMRQQGLVPTMDSIAELSDRYVALAPGIERVNFLQTTFGRGGAQFAHLMEQGSTALRDRSAAVEDGLVLTQRQLDQAEDLRMAEDDLRDSFRSIAVTIGNMAIPALASWTQELVHNISITRDAIDPAEELGRRFGGVAGYAGAMTQPTREAAFAIRDLETFAGGAAAEMAGLTQSMIDEQVQASEAAEQTRAVRDIIESLRDRHITITVSTVQAATQWAQQYVNTSAWQTTTTVTNPRTGTGGRQEYTARAAGGPLGPIVEVGEAGTEGIVNGVVIEHGMWERMKRAGIVATRHAQGGDDYFLRHRTSGGTGRRIVGGGVGAINLLGGYFSSRTAQMAGAVPGAGTGLGGATSSVSSAAQAAVTAAVTAAAVAEANAPIEAALAVMPQALGAQIIEPMRTQANAITKSNNELASLLSDIRLLLTRQATDGGIGRAVRDNMQAAG